MPKQQKTDCPRCGEKAYTDWQQTTTQYHAGTLGDGRPYTKIVRKWGRCKECGGLRFHREYK